MNYGSIKCSYNVFIRRNLTSCSDHLCAVTGTCNIQHLHNYGIFIVKLILYHDTDTTARNSDALINAIHNSGFLKITFIMLFSGFSHWQRMSS